MKQHYRLENKVIKVKSICRTEFVFVLGMQGDTVGTVPEALFVSFDLFERRRSFLVLYPSDNVFLFAGIEDTERVAPAEFLMIVLQY